MAAGWSGSSGVPDAAVKKPARLGGGQVLGERRRELGGEGFAVQQQSDIEHARAQHNARNLPGGQGIVAEIAGPDGEPCEKRFADVGHLFLLGSPGTRYTNPRRDTIATVARA